MKPKLRTPGDLAKLLGVRTERRPTYTPLWDGRSLNIQGLCTEVYVHELMHWLLATPFRRSLPNFGHGPARREAGGVWASMPYEKCRNEEIQVGVMTRACLKVMGLEGRFCNDHPERAKAERELTKKGLLDKQGRPVLPGLTYEVSP